MFKNFHNSLNSLEYQYYSVHNSLLHLLSNFQGAIESLDYALFSSFSKIFHTKSKDVIDQCLSLFGCPPAITVVNKRKVKFLADYVTACNSLCMLFACVAQKELDALSSNSLAT